MIVFTKAGLAISVASVVLNSFVRATSFDGQYLQPNSTNDAVEWWWGSAVGTPESAGTPGPVLQFLFYQGYSILVDSDHSSLPEYYFTINGFFPNGSDFSVTVPATSGNIIEGAGNVVTGTWGEVGSFQTSHDLKTIPYFDEFMPPPSQALTEAEQILFTQLGWAVSIPGGTVDVDVTINGTRLQFSGNGYHDQNWMPLALNEFVSSWYFGFAEIGPYTLSYVSVTPVNSSIAFNTGYLATDQAVLQNQCSVNGTKITDISIIQPKGEMTGAQGTVAPSTWTLSYIIEDGTEFEFEMVPTAANPNLNIYQRWTGSITGGKKGDESYEGVATFEWLNPGLNVYSSSA